MAITRAQQFRQMLIKGGIANPDGRRGFGGGADMGTVGDSKGNVGPGKGGYQGGGDGKGGKAGGEGDGPVDKSSNLQNVNHMIAMGLDVPQGPINLKPREIELQNFLDRRNKVNLFGLSKFFTGPLQKVSDFNASINRPFFKEVIRAGKIPGLSFDMTEEEYEEAYQDYMSDRLDGKIDAYGNPNPGYGKDDNPSGIMTQYIPPVQSQPEDGNDDDDFEFYRRFRADGGRAEYKQGSPKVDPRMKNTLAQNVASNNAQAAANAIQQAINTQTLTSPSSQMTTPQLPQPTSGTGPLFNPGFTVNTPTGPATFSSPGYYGSQGVMLDGKVYYSEKDAIDGLGIVRYNQLMADGGRAGFAEGGMPYEGGIMDLESARQMYGLGKLVKKVTKSVKKIAKSPIGKAALLYTGAAMAGSFGATGSLFSKGMFAPGAIKAGLFGQAMAPGFSGPGIPGLFTKLGLTKTAGSLMPTALGAIAGTSIVAGMLTPAQEEEAQRISDETGIDIEEIRANPDKYLGRRFKAEGGSIDEPVAKKTMPLLDMDGQEMDFRAEGGFVPIGRMEKADDVPARLSKNEFVFTADAVRNAGDGNVDKGAEVMYNMMKNLESGGDVSEESQGLEGARNMFQTSKRLEEVL